mmetsp:Transcript_54366/g.168661  ORF Transcript_54366/g.168661 Transcript_54366/m.168661 type:complete len:203 (+) Transcript_54366:1195-1803(+)
MGARGRCVRGVAARRREPVRHLRQQEARRERPEEAPGNPANGLHRGHQDDVGRVGQELRPHLVQCDGQPYPRAEAEDDHEPDEGQDPNDDGANLEHGAARLACDREALVALRLDHPYGGAELPGLVCVGGVAPYCAGCRQEVIVGVTAEILSQVEGCHMTRVWALVPVLAKVSAPSPGLHADVRTAVANKLLAGCLRAGDCV